MKRLRKIFPEDQELKNKKIYKRIAARGIILDGENILLIHTKRYDDYSFPGGGVDKGETLEDGVKREINEETGAQNIEIISEYGIYDEIKPIHKKDYDFINMVSYFFVCNIHKELGKTSLEDYEVNNGMDARWINIHEAIAHNKKVIKNQPKTIGLYIDRELFMLELVAKELIKKENK
ncbi:MAG TPA: DNA mismatch repair protein MutT [Fusobacteriaceae bacterium]|nr:DNA mismatch repair protein MutT [Fusobacteriaceae bacterium]